MYCKCSSTSALKLFLFADILDALPRSMGRTMWVQGMTLNDLFAFVFLSWISILGSKYMVHTTFLVVLGG